jgi:fructose-1,6-bisphosphatase/inositol monophosphatase family enzyme/aminoglycoside phosphotransferase (APT) family kinase protein
VDEGVVEVLGLDGTEVVPIVGGRVSKVWRATRHDQPVAVRQSPWFRGIDEVAYECELLGHLDRLGAPVAPAVVGPVLLDGAVWTAFAWAEGQHPALPVADPFRYGQLLAELHQASAQVASGLEQRPGWRRIDQFLTTPRTSGEATFAEVLPDFEKATSSVGRFLGRFARDVHERLAAADVEALPQLVAHGDFGPHQVLVRDDHSISAVVDWDFAHVDLALADLAIATSLARPTVDRAAAMLRGYFSTADGEIGDLALLGDLRRAFHLNNLSNQVCALWMNGIDIDRSIATITERLNREQWWGPTLLHAAGVAASANMQPAPERPPVSGTSSDLEIAHELADRAAVVAAHYFAEGVVAETKADATPVTEADRAVERLLVEGLRQLRPNDAVLGEEFGATGNSTRTWILDPIDGTAAYAAADPNWRIQIALQDDDRITVAVIDAPALGTRWWATAGGGAFERTTEAGTRPLDIAGRTADDPLCVAVHPASAAERLPPELTPVQRTPLPLIELVRGEIDAFYVDCCHLWDHAPWILLVIEAGGAFTDHAGTASGDQRGGLYSTRTIHDELLDRLRPPITRLGHLDAPSPTAVQAAVAKVRPDLARAAVSIPDDRTGGAPPWRRAAATLGESHFVKFSWSATAARKLWHEARVTKHLGALQPRLSVAPVEAVTPDPALLATRRVPGEPLWYPVISAMSPADRRNLARQVGTFLARLHASDTLDAIEAELGPMPAPVPQATTDALRARLGQFISGERTTTVARWCDWVDEIQAEPAHRVLLHGDFAGHNFLWDHTNQELVAVVDFEEAAAGDPNYDFRYLPAQAATLDLLHDVADEYAAAGGLGFDLRQVMAWSLRTVLGDALWRSIAGVPMPFGGKPDEWVDEMEDRLAAAGVMG